MAKKGWERSDEPPETLRIGLTISRKQHPEIVDFLWRLPYGDASQRIREIVGAHIAQQINKASLNAQAEKAQEELLRQLNEAAARAEASARRAEDLAAKLESTLSTFQDAIARSGAPQPLPASDMKPAPAQPLSEAALRFAKTF